MVHGTWCTVHGTWYMVHGTWFMVHGTWYIVHGTWYVVHGTWYIVHGTWYMVHGSWYMAHLHHRRHPRRRLLAHHAVHLARAGRHVQGVPTLTLPDGRVCNASRGWGACDSECRNITSQPGRFVPPKTKIFKRRAPDVSRALMACSSGIDLIDI